MCGRTADVSTHRAVGYSGDSSDGVMKSGGAPQSADLETSRGHPGLPQLGRILSIATLAFARSRIRWPRPFVTPSLRLATAGKLGEKKVGLGGVKRSNRDTVVIVIGHSLVERAFRAL